MVKEKNDESGIIFETNFTRKNQMYEINRHHLKNKRSPLQKTSYVKCWNCGSPQPIPQEYN